MLACWLSAFENMADLGALFHLGCNSNKVVQATGNNGADARCNDADIDSRPGLPLSTCQKTQKGKFGVCCISKEVSSALFNLPLPQPCIYF